jgi:hypothetical protein
MRIAAGQAAAKITFNYTARSSFVHRCLYSRKRRLINRAAATHQLPV